MFRGFLVASLLLGCTPMESGVPSLTVTTSPSMMDAISRTVRVRVVATNADGTIGVGTVQLTASPGELDDETLTLDEFGTAGTTLTCPKTSEACKPGAAIEVTVRWARSAAPLSVTASKVVRIGSLATTWSIDTCPVESKLVYLFTDTAELYSFHPPTKALRRIGTLACPSGAARPNSMAVSQDGTAYLNYSDGALYRVNVRNASCQATTFVPPAGWTRFGMGFKPETSVSVNETLYIAGSGSQGLARVDVQTMQTTLIGAFSGVATGAAELTGTADAELFGYFLPSGTGGAMRVAKINPANGVTSGERDFPELMVNLMAFAYAFSAWGTEFYLYTSSGAALSTVTKYVPATNQSLVHMDAAQVGIRIVGAGVSRCGQ